MTVELQSYVAGEWIDGTGPEHRDENPARPDETVATFRPVSAEVVDRAADVAGSVAASWRTTPMHERAAILARAAVELRARSAELGRELTREEGKTLPEGIGEVARAARILEYFAAEADRELGQVFASPRAGEQILTRQVPVGPVALITPWNFPIAIPAWKLAPALVFGNPVVWKASSVVPLLAVRLTEVLVRAGLPEGVLNLVLAGGEAGARLLVHPSIRACSFTGSTSVGRSVMSTATATGIKVQAEMGGVNVAVVLADADLDHAAAQIVSGAMVSSGQKCTATSRIVVDQQVEDELLERVVARCRALVVGDPLDAATNMGPVATPGQLRELAGAIESARASGARVLVDGEPAADPSSGYFVGPTVIADVPADHPLCREEVFGPSLAVTTATGTADALRLADAGEHGLTAAVFTRDLGQALAAMDQLEVGIVHLNSETTGAEVHVPFGGVKASGAGGREQGRAGRDFYTETRTVYLAAQPPATPEDPR
ncbi:MAG: aldHT 2 [Acidimicrobiales bacterium]|nr:aldHT 2 [Acidimicrobiales bacterium]